MPAIDQDNINIIGKSNGGLFVSELFLAYSSKKNDDDIKNLGFRINLFCNYMGGLEIENDREVFDFDQ